MIFELPSKDGNITPEKARKSRQMQLRDKTANVQGLRPYVRVVKFFHRGSELTPLAETLS